MNASSDHITSAGGCSPEAAIGWDLGGAHLKAALANADGAVVGVTQLACPLWEDGDALSECVGAVLAKWPHAGRHMLTMTGELCDVFDNRAQGVRTLVQRMLDRVPHESLWVYAGHRGFVEGQSCGDLAQDIASANWLASANFAASRVVHGVLIDVGSTTVDVVPFSDTRVRAQGSTDAQRLATAELVYTGVVRTPLCALAQRAPFAGRWQGLTAELFATTADVYRLLNLLPEQADVTDTADGRGKSVQESAARIARMFGRDVQDATLARWREVAEFFASRQYGVIGAALHEVQTGLRDVPEIVIVGAGVGRFLAERLASERGLKYRDFASLCATTTDLADACATCAPAVALAVVGAAERRQRRSCTQRRQI